jgi:UDP-glucose 4-epimerase
LHRQRILVTGGAGFIGSELVRQLAALGHRVVVVDNLVNGRRENLDGILGADFELIVGDIRDRGLISSVVADADVVFHLACLGVRHSIHSPVENHEVNASGTLALLNAARDASVKRFVYVSSSEVYGTAQTVPITEEHPTQPMTVYGASKLAGESYTRAFHKTYKFPTVVVRPFNSYGPRSHHEGDSGEVIPKFLLRCMAGKPMVIFGDGTQTRDFTYVGDTARGILSAGFSDACIGETINLGGGKEISILELASTIATLFGRTDAEIIHTDPRPGDVLRLISDNAKARNLLAVEPEVTFADGLARLRDWYLGQPLTPHEMLQQEVERNWEGRDVPSHA